MLANARANLAKFARLRLGLKPFFDYGQSRPRLLGIADLPIRTVFDIGSNVGKMAKRYRRLFPDARIYCFEPLPGCCASLQHWAAGQANRVKVFNVALGNETKQVQFYQNVRHLGGSSVLKPCGDLNLQNHVTHTVQMRRLDDVAASLDVRDGVFLKIDVEGFEKEVLDGGQQIVSKAQAVIIELNVAEPPPGRAFIDYVQRFAACGLHYRGNLTGAFVNGVPRLVDAVFTRHQAEMRVAA